MTERVQCIEKGWYKSSHLFFKDDGPNIKGGKTRRFNVFNTSHSLLGFVKWYGAWRKYCYFPLDGTLYDDSCLRQVADFCELVTREHKDALPVIKKNRDRIINKREKRIKELAERKNLTKNEDCNIMEENGIYN